MLVPLVSLLCSGQTVSNLAPGRAVLGRPTWDASTLLAQLELRLGLPRPSLGELVRLQRWSQRMAQVANGKQRFYSASYAADPLGTTRLLLEWRDELVLAGWNGQAVTRGGERLDTLAELEGGESMAVLAPGLPDRVRSVERELASLSRVFDGLDLAEGLELWPALWRTVFSRLEDAGTIVREQRVSLASGHAESDLGRVQALLRGADAAEALELEGDGSLMVLEAETSWELAQACAALLRGWAPPSAVVVRGGDALALDAAFAAQGLPSQGVWSKSPWRPAWQVLSLALELVFAPRDPQRVLELVTLPEGPFRGRVGRALAKALTAAPGIGGRAWQHAKQQLRDAGRDELQLAMIDDWLERPAHDSVFGAPLSELHEVALRVRLWLAAELSRAHVALAATPNDSSLARTVDLLGKAFAEVVAFQEGLAHETRERLRLVEARQLLDEIWRVPDAVELAAERAGRWDHVARPAGVRAARDVVVWWSCEAETERRPVRAPWRASEIAALEAAGVHLGDSSHQLAAEAASWHQPILAARKRLVFAVPRWALGRELAAHPILDELAGRLGATRKALRAVTIDARELLRADGSHAGRLGFGRDRVIDHGPLPLPEARPEWSIEPALVPASVSQSVTSLEALVRCPLKWTFDQCAGLHRGSRAMLPARVQLNGTLGHRLIEELHREGVFADPARVGEAALAIFDRLVREEAAVLLLAGEASELTQLRRQLCGAVESLARWVAARALEVVGVEVEARGPHRDGEIHGRIDLLLRDSTGRDVILDAKWGGGRYARLLEKGEALQLATYAWLRQLEHASRAAPRTAYFSLSSGRLMSTDGDLAGDATIGGAVWPETWRSLDATLGLVRARLARGRVAATGLTRSLPLLSGPEQPANDGDGPLNFENGSGCEYCDYSALCGRRWEQCA